MKRGYEGISGRRNSRSKSVKEKMSIAKVRESEEMSLVTAQGLIGSSGNKAGQVWHNFLILSFKSQAEAFGLDVRKVGSCGIYFPILLGKFLNIKNS